MMGGGGGVGFGFGLGLGGVMRFSGNGGLLANGASSEISML